MARYEIRLSGEGGQGLVLAGAILAEAIGIHGGKHVTYTQSYGPESRGGSCRSDVVIGDEAVNYPICSRLDLLLALTQKACDAYIRQLKPDGLLIVDENRVSELQLSAPSSKPSENSPLPNASRASTSIFRVCRLPILQTARVRLAKEVFANIVCVGIVGVLSGLASEDNLRRAVTARVPKGTEQLNLRALELGLKMANAWREADKTTASGQLVSARVSPHPSPYTGL